MPGPSLARLSCDIYPSCVVLCVHIVSVAVHYREEMLTNVTMMAALPYTKIEISKDSMMEFNKYLSEVFFTFYSSAHSSNDHHLCKQ